MGRHSSAQPTAPRTALRRAAAVIATCASIAAVTVGAASSATAGSAGEVRRGAGSSIARGTDWVGQYRVTVGGRSVAVYCINPTKRQPGRLALSTVSRVPGLTTTASREIAQVLAAHGDTRRAVQAEATSQAVNYLAGNRGDVSRRARYLAASTQRLAMAYVAQARRLRGGWTVRLHLSGAPLPGQSGRGTVSVSGPGGGQAVSVALTHSGNVTTPARLRTSSRGTATYTYRTTGAGQVRVAAAVVGLAPVTVRVSRPTAGYQRMVSASPTTGANAAATYQWHAGGFGHGYACSSECAGHPVVTLRACAPASTVVARLIYVWRGGAKVMDFAPSRARVCHSTTARISDGVRVSATWRFRQGSRWTTLVAAGGGFVVDCPAAPPVAVTVSYDCTAASVTAVLGRQVNGVLVAAANTSAHRMELTVSGAASGRFELTPGARAAVHTWPMTCGQHARVTLRSAVQRAGGGWNSGAPVTVTLP